LIEKYGGKEKEMVSNVATSMMFTNMLIAIAIPIFFMIAYKKRYGVSLKGFFMGCLSFFLFAYILETVFHLVFLSIPPVKTLVQGSVLAHAVYGGLIVGICEETGRYFIMKVLMKNDHDNPYNSLMYGAGYGGLEVLLLLGLTMFSNWTCSVMINAELTDMLYEGLDEAGRLMMDEKISQLINSSPYIYMAPPVERIAALILHIALSVLVWTAVTKGMKYLYPMSIGFHFGFEVLSQLLSAYKLPMPLIEIIVMAYAVGVAYYAKNMVWDKQLKNSNIKPKRSYKDLI